MHDGTSDFESSPSWASRFVPLFPLLVCKGAKPAPNASDKKPRFAAKKVCRATAQTKAAIEDCGSLSALRPRSGCAAQLPLATWCRHKSQPFSRATEARQVDAETQEVNVCCLALDTLYAIFSTRFVSCRIDLRKTVSKRCMHPSMSNSRLLIAKCCSMRPQRP